MTPHTATRTYRILHVQFEPEHREEFREYPAVTLSEALEKAQQADAGREECAWGIQPKDYGTARTEGISFNEADGLLI